MFRETKPPLMAMHAPHCSPKQGLNLVCGAGISVSASSPSESVFQQNLRAFQSLWVELPQLFGIITLILQSFTHQLIPSALKRHVWHGVSPVDCIHELLHDISNQFLLEKHNLSPFWIGIHSTDSIPGFTQISRGTQVHTLFRDAWRAYFFWGPNLSSQSGQFPKIPRSSGSWWL